MVGFSDDMKEQRTFFFLKNLLNELEEERKFTQFIVDIKFSLDMA